MKQIVVNEKIFARLDNIERGDANSTRMAEQHIFRNTMYLLEIIKVDEKTYIALKGVVGWYDSRMFSFYTESGDLFRIEKVVSMLSSDSITEGSDAL